MRIIATAAAPHPQAEIVSVDAAGGTCFFNWLDAEGARVDSGGSLVLFDPIAIPDTDPIEYAEPDDDALALAIANPPAPVQTQAEIYATALAPGYLDDSTGLRLKATEAAQSKFTSALALLDLALGAGALTSASDFTFWDYADQMQTLSVADFKALMLRYGLWCAQQFADFAP